MEYIKFARTSERKVFGLDITKADRNWTYYPPFDNGHQVITSDITVKDGSGNYITFPFYDSIATTEAVLWGVEKGIFGKGARSLTRGERVRVNKDRHKTYNIAWAAYCGLTDGIMYANSESIGDFQQEFGYEGEIECIQVYDTCKKIWEEWSKLELPGGIEDLWDLANKIQEEYEL